MTNGVWEVPTLVDATEQGTLSFEFGVMPLPQWFDSPATWADSSTLAIPHSPRNPISDARLEGALEFIAYVNKNSIIWASGGHIPAYLPVVMSEQYQTMTPNIDYAEARNNLAFEPNNPIAGAASPMFTASSNYLDPVIDGRLTVEQGVDGFERELQQILSEQN